MKIRPSSGVLAVSLLLNLALLGGALRLQRRLAELAARPAPPPPAAEPAPPPFRWSQLESSDYLVYIANLRGIGCPEQTVREIVAADVFDLFAPRRDPLLAKISGNSATPAERSQAEAALRQVGLEQAALYRRLFGIPDPVGSSAPAPAQVAASPPTPRTRRRAVEDTTVTMPMVFQTVNANALKLTADDIQTINEVRQSFMAALGTNQDVNSLEYLHRWQKAQKQADSLLDGLLGRQFTLKYEEEAENQAAANRPPPLGNQP